MMEPERRDIKRPVELRADTGAGKTMVAGYAAVFNTETDIGGDFREKIMPGAFAETIKNADIRSLFDHNSALILGRTKSGTLRLWEDEDGLRYEVDLPDTQAGRDLKVSMERGDIDGSSFAFRVTHDEWNESLDQRTIHAVELYEVGPVTFPAYPQAAVALRSREQIKAERENEIKEHNREGWLRRKANSIRNALTEQRARKIPGEPEA